MKPKTLFAALLLVSAPAAFAATTAEIKVSGSITPAACNITGGTTINLGTINSQSLKQDVVTPIGSGATQLTVTCDNDTRFALKLTDNQSGSASDTSSPENLGLGLSSSKPVGYWKIALSSPTNSGTALRRTTSLDGGVTWQNASDQAVYMQADAADRVGFTTANNGDANGPAALSNFLVTATAEAFAAPAKDLDLSQEISVDGSATIELHYL